MEWGMGRWADGQAFHRKINKKSASAMHSRLQPKEGSLWNLLSLTDIVPLALHSYLIPSCFCFTDKKGCEPLCANKAKLEAKRFAIATAARLSLYPRRERGVITHFSRADF